MEFLKGEQRDGARFSWNVFPSSRLEATKMGVPVAMSYTPRKPIEGLATVQYQPISCKNAQCGSVLNPYCRVDFRNKIWVCPFCQTRNYFPPHYAEMSPESPPAEILPQFTTLEYVLDANARAAAPVFVFVVDTCMIEEELQQVKASLLQSLLLLPPNSLLGLISFGANVHVHELSFDECPKSYVFRGSKAIDAARLAALLGITHPGKTKVVAAPPPAATRFLMPVSECEFQFTAILDALTKDCWPHKSTERAQRCTGTALGVALGLLESTHKGQSARVMMFVGGPPSVGEGAVCSLQRAEAIRSHHDIQKGNAPLHKPAKAFYDKLAAQASENGHVVDLFACALDQVGLAEMQVCVSNTGGLLVLDDSFTKGVFLNSFQRAFTRDAQDNNDLVMAFSGELQVLTSREFKLTGCVGNVTGLDRKTSSVAPEEEVGLGGTSAWALGGMDTNSTVSLYFEMVTQNEDKAAQGQLPQAYVQLVTKYRHSSGRTHLRVSTIAKTMADPKTEEGRNYLRAGFDQEAAAVLMARWAIWRTRSEFTFDILRWLDRQLIKLVAKFAQYKKDDPSSFRLAQEFAFFPQFMFHLRRSQFLQVFNSSPDETAFFRTVALNQSVSNVLVMIQPSLIAYSLDGPPQPVQLDVSACDPRRILVLDTFFRVVIWYGGTIHQWQLDGLHLKPEYDYLANLLAAPKAEAQALMESRLPYPKFIECVEKKSQARFLLAKLNPSITQTTDYGGAEPPIFSEDVSLKVFMEHLQRLTVQTN